MSINLLKTRSATLNLQALRNLQKCCYSTKDRVLADIEVEEVPVYDAEPKYTQDYIDSVRNKSRLAPQHRRQLNDVAPYDAPQERYHNQVDYRRRLLGRYGLQAPNVDPVYCWPTKEEIEDIKEYERVLYPETIQDLWKKIEEKKKQDALEIKKREEEIDKVVANFDKWQAALEAKIAKKEAEILAAKEKKKAMLEEMQSQFGYKIDPRDERFQEMLEQKAKEDKKRKKAEKQKLRAEKMMAHLKRQEEELKAKQEAEAATSQNAESSEEKVKSKVVESSDIKESKQKD